MTNDEKLFRRFLEAAPDAMIVVDRGGRIVMGNAQAERLFGYPREELIGQTVEMLVPERYRSKHKIHQQGYFGAPGVRPMGVGLELFGLQKDGTEVPVEISLSPLEIDGETVAIAAIRDITERRKADVERANLIREQAARAEAELTAERLREERIAADEANRQKDQFLAMLSHELRNPLGAILTAVHLLDRIGKQDESAVRAREVIARQTQHLARMVDDLLEVGRVMRGRIRLDRRTIDLADAVRHCVSTLEAAGKAKRHMITVNAESVWVDADPVRLEEILVNLIGNALKYTPAGGSIGITVKREEQDAVFQVQDSGDGIAADLLPRVFDPFVQGDRGLDRGPGGLGIGLALVRQLVELHRGGVQASSDGPGRGSTFTIRLPRVSPKAPEVPPHVDERHTTRRRVLIVEDNIDTREMLRTLLELSGHEVYEAADGRSGIDEVLRVRPDVALVDIGLPGMDGYELARRIREVPEGKKIRVVALTGYALPEARQRSREAGFDFHLVKPIDAKKLAQLLDWAS